VEDTLYPLFVVNKNTGDTYTCYATMTAGPGLPPTYFLNNIACSKWTIISGTIPKNVDAPVVITEPSENSPTFPLGLWRIDPISGTLTFCGGSNTFEYKWLCGEQKLPQ
jgi:hypothetical protein